MVGLADLYAEQKRTDDAVRMLEQARKTFGDDRSADHAHGERRMKAAASWPKRRRNCGALMAEDPLNADALNSLSYMLAERGMRLPEAVDLAQRAVKIEPDNPSYLDTLGWALFKQGKAEEAAEPLGEGRRAC